MNTKLIEKHIDRALNAEETQEFAREFHTNHAFRQDVEVYEQLVRAIRHAGRKNDIAQVHQAFIRERNRPHSASRWRTWAAACLVLIISSVLMAQSLPSSTELYGQAYTPYKVHIMRSESPQSALSTSYAQEDYSAFLQAYEQLKAPSAHEQMMAGNVYLIQGQTQKAIEHFGDLQAQNNTEMAEVAQWYQAMAYLEAKQPQLAYPLLKQIRKNPSHLFRKQASLGLMLKVKANDLLN
jgi:hypothetical protein